MQSLLADIVASRGLAPEPVATDSLVHLLGRSAAGRMEMTRLLQELTGAATDGMSFTGQHINGLEEGRPDAVGADAFGNRLVVEAKFDADLTPHQLGPAYLGHLAKGMPGALLFLVPADRLDILWPKIMREIGAPTSPPDAQDEDPHVRSHVLSSTHTIAAITWSRLLQRLEHSLMAAVEADNIADLRQLQGLVEWRTRGGWVPVQPEDLPMRVGRQLDALARLVCAAASESSVGTARYGSSDVGPGRYVTSARNNKYWVGIWFPRWARDGDTPVWMQVKATTTISVDSLMAALHATFPDAIARATSGQVVIPVHLPVGAEESAVRAHLISYFTLRGSVLDTMTDQTGGAVSEEGAEVDDLNAS